MASSCGDRTTGRGWRAFVVPTEDVADATPRAGGGAGRARLRRDPPRRHGRPAAGAGLGPADPRRRRRHDGRDAGRAVGAPAAPGGLGARRRRAPAGHVRHGPPAHPLPGRRPRRAPAGLPCGGRVAARPRAGPARRRVAPLWRDVPEHARLLGVLADQFVVLPDAPLQLPLRRARWHGRWRTPCSPTPPTPATWPPWPAPPGPAGEPSSASSPARSGMPVGAWRQRLRLVTALRLLAAGHTTTEGRAHRLLAPRRVRRHVPHRHAPRPASGPPPPHPGPRATPTVTAMYVAVSGPPGSGKTTLARALAAELGLPLLRSPSRTRCSTYSGAADVVESHRSTGGDRRHARRGGQRPRRRPGERLAPRPAPATTSRPARAGRRGSRARVPPSWRSGAHAARATTRRAGHFDGGRPPTTSGRPGSRRRSAAPGPS